jgi:hypothetical protein
MRVHHQCQLKKAAPILWMQHPLVGCLSEGIQQSVSSVRDGWGHIGIADVGLMNVAIVAMFETPALHIHNISWCPLCCRGNLVSPLGGGCADISVGVDHRNPERWLARSACVSPLVNATSSARKCAHDAGLIADRVYLKDDTSMKRD